MKSQTTVESFRSAAFYLSRKLPDRYRFKVEREAQYFIDNYNPLGYYKISDVDGVLWLSRDNPPQAITEPLYYKDNIKR